MTKYTKSILIILGFFLVFTGLLISLSHDLFGELFMVVGGSVIISLIVETIITHREEIGKSLLYIGLLVGGILLFFYVKDAFFIKYLIITYCFYIVFLGVRK